MGQYLQHEPTRRQSIKTRFAQCVRNLVGKAFPVWDIMHVDLASSRPTAQTTIFIILVTHSLDLSFSSVISAFTVLECSPEKVNQLPTHNPHG